MSDTIVRVLPFSVDLSQPLKKTYIDTLMATEDNQAHRFDVSLFKNKAQIDMPEDAAVNAYIIRYCDNATITLTNGDDGNIVSVSENIVSVTLKKSCYNRSGQFALIIKVVTGGIVSTVFYGEGTMLASSTDTILDDENVIPSLSDLLNQIAAMEAATKAANTATEKANTAAQHAPYVDEATNHWMAWDTESGEYIDTGANATGEKGEPGNTPHIGENGNWYIGDTDTGVKAQGPAGQNGTGSGTVTAVTVSGVKHEPDHTGNVDLGELSGGGGKGTVTSVNGEAPDENGNVQIRTLTSDPREAEEEAPEMGSVPINADQLGGKTYQMLIDLIYPIGRTITTLDDADNPNTLYPWQEWERTAKGRMLIGTGAPEDNDDGTSPGEYNYPAGSTGGEAEHTLTNEEMPSHTHQTQGYYALPADGVSGRYATSMGIIETDPPTVNTSNLPAGGDQPHNNMPPYLAVNVWKRVS